MDIEARVLHATKALGFKRVHIHGTRIDLDRFAELMSHKPSTLVLTPNMDSQVEGISSLITTVRWLFRGGIQTRDCESYYNDSVEAPTSTTKKTIVIHRLHLFERLSHFTLLSMVLGLGLDTATKPSFQEYVRNHLFGGVTLIVTSDFDEVHGLDCGTSLYETTEYKSLTFHHVWTGRNNKNKNKSTVTTTTTILGTKPTVRVFYTQDETDAFNALVKDEIARESIGKVWTHRPRRIKRPVIQSTTLPIIPAGNLVVSKGWPVLVVSTSSPRHIHTVILNGVDRLSFHDRNCLVPERVWCGRQIMTQFPVRIAFGVTVKQAQLQPVNCRRVTFETDIKEPRVLWTLGLLDARPEPDSFECDGVPGAILDVALDVLSAVSMADPQNLSQTVVSFLG
jgi:hypothetical protein